MDALHCSSNIVDTYLDSIKGNPSKMSNVLTLSVVALEYVGKIAEEIDILASLLLKLKRESPKKLVLTEKLTNKFHISAHITGKYVPYSVLLDLNDFVINLRVGMAKNKQVSESAQRISKLLQKAIIKERHQPLEGEYNLGIEGTSLYFAGMDTKGYSGNRFSVDTKWDEYITESHIFGK